MRKWLGFLAAIGVLGASPAYGEVITFDSLNTTGRGAEGLAVDTQYAAQGVTFTNARAFDYAKAPLAIAGFAHSPTVAVEPCAGVEFCAAPLRATFASAKQTARVWVGFSFALPTALGVRLTGFNAESQVIDTDDATLPANANPTLIRTALSVSSPTARISRIEVSVTTGGGYTGGLAVDDVEFTAAVSPTPTPSATATATPACAPPVVALSQPPDGLVVQQNAFPLAGSIDPNGAPITAAALFTGAFTSPFAAGGGAFGPTIVTDRLELGVNTVAVSATNCGGTGTSPVHRVLRTVAPPGPHPAACGRQPDHPEVVVATDAKHLADTINSGFQGQVILRRDVEYNLTKYAPLTLGPGVQLVGERDALGGRPLVRTGAAASPLFSIPKPDVCVEGLRVEGPSRGTSRELPQVRGFDIVQDPCDYPTVAAIKKDPCASHPRSRPDPVVIADSELAGWTQAAVAVEGSKQWEDREADEPYEGERMTRRDADLVRIERNYIHHNTRDENGYGVMIGGSAYATVEGNVFDLNRHDVTTEGQSYSGYIARLNYMLGAGYKYGKGEGYYAPHLDAHGTGGGKKHVGGIAGEYYLIASNTIRGEQDYECGRVFCSEERASMVLRGTPMSGLDYIGNVDVHEDIDDAIKRKGVSSSFEVNERGNLWDTDNATKLVPGDFDGDRRTDVLLTTGAAWYFSRAGRQPWEFLRGSTLLRDKLAFADIDNDGATDVLRRTSSDELQYYKSGVGSPVPVTTVPVPIGDLRFGDFDGDGRTDVFYTHKNRWQVWYGGTSKLAAAATSQARLANLLFGEFDGVTGTDVATVRSGEWSYSSAATQPWKRLNAKLRGSFADAVAANFDGVGGTDIAFDEDGAWRYSPGGRGAMARLRREVGSVGALKRLLIGRFGTGARDMVIAFDPQNKDRFAIWRGVGSADAFQPWSLQNVR